MPDRATSREQTRARVRACRERQRNGDQIVPVKVNELEVELLVAAGMLPQDCDDAERIGEAVDRAGASREQNSSRNAEKERRFRRDSDGAHGRGTHTQNSKNQLTGQQCPV